MNSFFLGELNKNVFEIKNEDFHHIKNVIKLREKEQILCIFDNSKYLCEITQISDNTCFAQIVSKIQDHKKQYRVNLILGIIREQKWDFVLQKATELGVDTIIPVEFKRNVVKVDQKKEANKIQRWLSICESAAKQSKRTSIPDITTIIRNINDLEKYSADLNLVCWEEEKKNTLKSELAKEFKTINIVIGPEGGISPEEIIKLNKLGYINVSLGDNIMRAETVPLFLLSCLSYEKEG
ncbi:RsmE family RNA methyltransferase [Spiroplasma monobiae]|uniref:Ribosomal RNA small subunit methyltransferase E n=1 Tax=Spiroplasma monobiae MQ-1 TaxID=1336748 RepID=A0A2K9LXX1_SPISQ|nr:16S rRNA (uracil(1498)-N(3))-methyltransferase [Spiroplasma monobiae]AUM62574.1 16S ribosomal RNA methyltransferase RsmE [Spiroplasma monobiae MQ-1]